MSEMTGEMDGREEGETPKLPPELRGSLIGSSRKTGPSSRRSRGCDDQGAL